MFLRKSALLVVALLFTASIAKAQQSTPPATKAPTPSTAADVTGTWNGTLKPVVDGSAKGEESGMLVLKQDGAVVTGTAGPRPDAQRPISNGKVVTTKEGTVVSFDLSNDSGMVMKFEMKLVSGSLKGTAKAERNGQKMEAALDFARAK